jgi:tripartite ATP-independent transporter DctP family solute receptor
MAMAGTSCREADTMKLFDRTIAAALLTIGGLATASTTLAQEQLRLGHDQVTQHTYQATTEFFAQRVSELTDGAVTVQIFPGATLGTETSMLQEVISGNLDLSVSTTANASSFVPKFGMLSVSYLFANGEHFKKALVDEEFNALIDAMIEEQDSGFIRVASITPGARSLYNIFGPVDSLDDVAGKRMRVMASPVESEVWGQLGTLPVAIPFGDVYTGMQTGLVDAAENSPGSYILNKHHEVAPYFSLTEHQWPISLIFMNKERFDSLSAEHQAAILEAGRETAAFGVDNAISGDNALLAEMESTYGVTVNRLDTAPFVEKLAALQDQKAEELGTTEILARVRALR